MDPKSVLLGLREKSVGLSKAQTRIPWREIISLKIQGVKEVIVIIDNANENAKKLYLSFGFHSTGKIDKAGYCYKLEI